MGIARATAIGTQWEVAGAPILRPGMPTACATPSDVPMPARRLPTRPLTHAACWALLVAAAAAFAQPTAPLRPAPMAAATPNDAARGFYAVYLAWRNWGVVSDAGRRPFTPVVSAGLAADLAAMSDAEGRKASAGMPPGAPRDLFTSLAVGADRADVGRCTTRGEAARCEVTLAIRDPVTGIDHRWRDTAIVRRERGTWVVDDVEYGARWPGANSGTLRANLQASFAPPPPGQPPPPLDPPAPSVPSR